MSPVIRGGHGRGIDTVKLVSILLPSLILKVNLRGGLKSPIKLKCYCTKHINLAIYRYLFQILLIGGTCTSTGTAKC